MTNESWWLKWLILFDKLFDWLEILKSFVAEKIRVGPYFENKCKFSHYWGNLYSSIFLDLPELWTWLMSLNFAPGAACDLDFSANQRNFPLFRSTTVVHFWNIDTIGLAIRFTTFILNLGSWSIFRISLISPDFCEVNWIWAILDKSCSMSHAWVR